MQDNAIATEATIPIERATTRLSGVPEVDVEWLRSVLGQVRLVDVRGADELRGPLPAIPGSEHVPLGELLDAAESWDRQQPLVIVCRSGVRSARAALVLEEMGFSRVASLAGGVLDWHRCDD